MDKAVERNISPITRWLSTARPALFVLYAATAAFMSYFSMYAFRKPIAVGTFLEVDGWDYQLDFKTAVILAQVFGYALSKWIGIKVISEMTEAKRAAAILLLVCVSELALVLFAILPPEMGVVALFLNGLPLGMIWGLVFSYLEGRRTSEVLGVILCSSYIFSSGAVKSIGKYLMLNYGVTELWMPAVTGALFLPPLFLFVYLLSFVPAPNAGDIKERQARIPMDGTARKLFLLHYLTGLTLLVALYVLLSAFRDFRDIFAAEIWIALGYGSAPEMFTLSEIPSTIGILVVLGGMMVIKDNLKAFKLYHLLLLVGLGVLAGATWAFKAEMIGGATWMAFLSFGLYLGYVPFNCILFDRLMAVTVNVGNAGFLIYVADSLGYAGSALLLTYKSLFAPTIAWLPFLEKFSYVTAFGGAVFVILSLAYFSFVLQNEKVKAV